MKRKFNLAGSIVGTVFSALNTLSGFFSIFIISSVFAVESTTTTTTTTPTDPTTATTIVFVYGAVIAILVISLIFSAVALVLNACSISASNKSKEEYAKRRGVIITAVVFNFLIALVYFVTFIIALIVSPIGILMLFDLAGFVVPNVFYILDLCKESKREEIKEEEKEKEVEKPKLSNIEKFEEINRIAELHDKKVLTDEEFLELKDKILKN